MGFLGLIGFGGGATGLSNVSGSSANGIVAATGGSVYTVGDYKLHVFILDNAPETFAVSSCDPNAPIEVLVCGSGGSGAPDQGSGGGGGGVVYTTTGVLVSQSTYPITISPASVNNAPIPGNPSSSRGGDSVFGSPTTDIKFTAKGGGFGGYFSPRTDQNADYRDGGCGGGMGNMPGEATSPTTVGATGYQPTEPQTWPTGATFDSPTGGAVVSSGYPGGSTPESAVQHSTGAGGGGGGAGQAGFSGLPTISPEADRGRGGNGYQVPSDFLDPFKPALPSPFLAVTHDGPDFRYFGAGGGGSDYNNNSGSARNYGPLSGLGQGGQPGPTAKGDNGRGAKDPGGGGQQGWVGTGDRGGGGGGGSTHSGNGRFGGSGVVLVKYKYQ